MLVFTVAENEIISNVRSSSCNLQPRVGGRPLDLIRSTGIHDAWLQALWLLLLAVVCKAMPFRVSIGRDSVFRLPDKQPSQIFRMPTSS